MRIVVGGDSAGQPLSDVIFKHLSGGPHEVVDLGREVPGGKELYASLAERVSNAILEGRFDRGICAAAPASACVSRRIRFPAFARRRRMTPTRPSAPRKATTRISSRWARG